MTAAATDTRGVALMEFALSLPILLTIALYGVETANLAIASTRVNQIANTIADNAARVRDSIDERDVNELLLGANLIGGSIDFGTRGRVVVSSVSPNGQTGSKAGQWIRWQRCTGALNTAASQPRYGKEGAGKSDGSLKYIGTAARPIAATGTTNLIYTEVTYRYKPIVAEALFGPKVLRSEAAFSVRERKEEDLKSANSATKSVCTVYSAT
ncbi:TadE/TadG family type IV pilus assembly protein [Sphingomonas sp. ac-8]|uniref:TadE/TadG family type IV pilus assembly protein n=1 Tax=Sphingomonas sp. ac-8 TaxID=3242977 RepID=UPI003A8092B6